MAEIKKAIKNIFKIYKNLINLDYKLKHFKISVLYESERMRLFEITRHSVETGVTDYRYCDSNITVSLTTYGRRFYSVHTTIESIMQQTMKPNKIVLWLDKSFEKMQMPIVLKNQEKRGLEIRFCEDIKSYKKLIPTLSLYPNDTIITCDDDVIYSPDMIENLTREYLVNPSKKIIYANVCHKIKLSSSGCLLSYAKWEHNTSDEVASKYIFPVGVGGVLYPPKSLYHDVNNINKFMELSPFGDDIWFKAMGYLNGYICKKVKTPSENSVDYLENIDFRDSGLAQLNNIQNHNDSQINNVFNEYKIVL